MEEKDTAGGDLIDSPDGVDQPVEVFVDLLQIVDQVGND